MKRKFLSIALAVTAIFSLVACGAKKTSQTSTSVNNTTTSNSVIVNTEKDKTPDKKNSKMTESENVAFNFIKDLQERNFDDAYELVNLRDRNLVTKEDIESGLDRFTEFRSIIGRRKYEVDIKKTKEEANTANVSVTVEDKEFDSKYDFEISMIKNENDEWKVDLSKTGAYLTNFKLYATEGFKLTVNGSDMDAYYTSTDRDGVATYTIDEIGFTQKEVTSSTKTYGNVTLKFEPWSEYRYYYMFTENDRTREVVRNDIKKLLTEMIDTCNSTNGDVNEMSKFLASDAKISASDMVTVMKDVYARGYSNIIVDDVVFRNREVIGPTIAPSLFITNPETENFRANLGLMVRYTDADGEHENNRRGSIGVKYENGTLKITDIDNARIFLLDYTNSSDFSSANNY